MAAALEDLTEESAREIMEPTSVVVSGPDGQPSKSRRVLSASTEKVIADFDAKSSSIAADERRQENPKLLLTTVTPTGKTITGMIADDWSDEDIEEVTDDDDDVGHVDVADDDNDNLDLACGKKLNRVTRQISGKK